VRAISFTGQYAHFNGVQDFFTAIRLETTYPYYLREAGYYTGFIGKWGTRKRDTSYFTEKVRKFLDQCDTKKPFCLSVSFKAPHAPWSDTGLKA